MRQTGLRRHERRFIQDILRYYPLMRSELAELEQERQEAADIHAGTPLTENPAQRQQAMSDPTYKSAFRLLRLTEQWTNIRFYVTAIEDTLECLDVGTRKLVELKYFQDKQLWQIESELGVTRATVFRWDNEALLVFAQRLGI